MNGNGTPDRAQITCPHCNQVFSVEVPVCEIVNTERFSTVVAFHPQPIICPNNLCKQKFQFVITGIGTEWSAQPKPRESSLLLPQGLKVVGRG